MKNDNEGKIKQCIVALCLDVMEILLSNASKRLIWHGPLTRKTKAGFPKEQKLPLVLGGLAGLAVYIKFEGVTTLEEWEPAKRNNFARNGPFLNSLYACGNNRAQEYGVKKEKVKTLRKAFKEEAAKGDFPVDTEQGISRVVDALSEKGIQIDDLANKINFLREGLNSVVAGENQAISRIVP